MVKIIETFLSMKDGKVFDHQSRIIEAESWGEYVNYYKENIKSDRQHSKFKSLTSLFGDPLPRYGDITDLKYDECHVSCYHTNSGGMITTKLAYLL